MGKRKDEIVLVICQDELEEWIRKALIGGKDAAMLLSDLLPEWTYINESKEIETVCTICLLANQRHYFLSAKKCLGEDPDLHNPLFRFEISINKKSGLMKQDFAEGEGRIQSPQDWVSWAIDKNFEINWLEYALEEGYFPEILVRIQANEQLHRRYMPAAYYRNRIATAIPTEDEPQNCVIVAEKETTEQRHARIVNYVNTSKAQGKLVKTAVAEIASIEGCGSENIQRIRKLWKKRGSHT